MGRAPDAFRQKIKFIEVFMLKIFMTMLVTLMFGAPCAAKDYYVSESKATAEFSVHPGTLVKKQTWTGDTFKPSDYLKMEIPVYDMYRRVWPEGLTTLTISDPSAELDWGSGEQRLRFLGRDRVGGGFVLYQALYDFRGNKVVLEKTDWTDMPVQGTAKAYLYCPLPNATSDSGAERISVKSVTSVTGMLDPTGYNSNALVVTCEWTLLPKTGSINISFVDSDVLDLSGVSGQDVTGSFEVKVTKSNSAGGYALEVTSDSDVSFREDDYGPYSPVLAVTRPATGAYDYVTIGVHIKPAAAGSYVHNVKVTATLL